MFAVIFAVWLLLLAVILYRSEMVYRARIQYIDGPHWRAGRVFAVSYSGQVLDLTTWTRRGFLAQLEEVKQ